MIQMRLDTEQLGDTLPVGWPQVQNGWLDALANVFAAVTPQTAESALAATRNALDALPFVHGMTVGPAMPTRCRMRALLHFTELTLQDDTLPLWRATGAAA
jgi:hypothetical protein